MFDSGEICLEHCSIRAAQFDLISHPNAVWWSFFRKSGKYAKRPARNPDYVFDFGDEERLHRGNICDS